MQIALEKIRKILVKKNLDAVLVSSNSNIAYLTNYSNFSSLEREAYLLITLVDQFIITDPRYSQSVLKNTIGFKLLEISSDNPLKKVVKGWSKKHKIKSLGFEIENLTVLEFEKFKPFFKSLKSIDLTNLRSIKVAGEIAKIKKACETSDLAFEYIKSKIKVGISEQELAFILEGFIKNQGADLSFPPIIAFGENSSIPHHQTGQTIFKKDSIILIDFGVKFENYCSDMSRTICINNPPKKLVQIHKAVLNTQKKAEIIIQDELNKHKKAKAANADKEARNYLISKGYKSIPHALGHGIGLEVHENPRLHFKSTDYLKDGVVFSIEPGVYIPNFGGVRIEDLYTIQNNTLVKLTSANSDLVDI